ncbi:MAG: alpha/beta fold hydrolase [Candidatus Lambdaproteobacteria bacterium]|nr:alpha/beta fold hydrolase [Candidatus Lambdaproteobacteria bacterium]
MTRVKVGTLYIDHELRGAGPPLLMVPGFRRSRAVWMEPLLTLLAERFSLVLIDNRGTGNSDKPEDGYSIEGFADDAAGLLDALGIARAHVFGVSMGGMIAQRIATRHPHKVSRLVIGCSHCGRSGAVPPEPHVLDLLRLMPNDSMDEMEVAYRQEEVSFTPTFRRQNRALLDTLFQALNANPTPAFAVAGHLAALEAFDACGDLGAIRAPTLFITGQDDRLIVPENSRSMARTIPGARLVELPQAGHLFWVEKPRETAEALIEFLIVQGGSK